ncbi:LacI family DNA-binding transcriptional regulator [Cryptosporangium arvum]|uniref:LacI family DNA-binding transcriptional regulator n=1 Tax=Cryptosporangium arvum TaxID=80871 RepID=UPI0004B5C917|nr:LacI family DNA-binding transcriptional regulator [Cryptosporangium arvum]
MSNPRRITQRDIARLARVSQATVSLVLNNRTDAGVRIAPETRERVLEVIRETGYVADPIARRLVDRRNRIIGVFTYEPVFPSATRDFYHPFLVGIEEAAERLGCDLLLFTSTPVIDGRRRILHEDNRLRLADGSVLLGRHMDADDLSKLVADGYPIAAVGRRDHDAVPYVGAGYAAATAALVRDALALGHRTTAYVGPGAGAESSADRLRGYRETIEGAAVGDPLHAADVSASALDALLAAGATALFVEEPADAVALVGFARERGLDVPADLSVLTLGDPVRPIDGDPADRLDFTGFSIPRRAMGWQAVEVLTAALEGETADLQRLLACEPVVGATLARPAAR